MKIIDASEPEFGGPMTEDEVRFFLVNSHKMFIFHPWMKKENLPYILHGIILTITMTNFTQKMERNPRKLETSEEIISCTIALMMTIFHTKELEAREQ